MSAVLCLALKHGLVLESRRLYTTQDSTRRGRLEDERPLATSVLHHGLRRVVLFLPLRLHLRGFEHVQLNAVHRVE